MQNNILINVVSYDKSEIKRHETINIIAKIHAHEIDVRKFNKKQLMRSKNTGEIMRENFATFDLLCN